MTTFCVGNYEDCDFFSTQTPKIGKPTELRRADIPLDSHLPFDFQARTKSKERSKRNSMRMSL